MNINIQEIKDLSIGFRSQKGDQISILRNITTNIKKGETVGIVGESGLTLLLCLQFHLF